MIDVKVINSFILIQKVKEHREIKQHLLSLINDMPSKRTETGCESIEKTDWYLPKEHNREYGNIFLEVIKEYNENIRNFYKAKNYWIQNYWYQQYYEKDYHNWHVHSGALTSNVYYLEMPNNDSTVFYDYLLKQEYEYEVEEGDLITFPAMLPHRSKINLKGRKTVIAYNADYDYINM